MRKQCSIRMALTPPLVTSLFQAEQWHFAGRPAAPGAAGLTPLRSDLTSSLSGVSGLLRKWPRKPRPISFEETIIGDLLQRLSWKRPRVSFHLLEHCFAGPATPAVLLNQGNIKLLRGVSLCRGWRWRPAEPGFSS